MRFLYATDLHGDIWKYDRLLDVAIDMDVDLVINGGDLAAQPPASSQARFYYEFLNKHFSRYDEAGIRLLLIPGNDDCTAADDMLNVVCDLHPLVDNIDRRPVLVEDVWFVGLSLVPDYPFRLKDRARLEHAGARIGRQNGPGVYSTITGAISIADWAKEAARLPTFQEELNSLPSYLPDHSVYVLHSPPFGVGLDVSRHGPVGSVSINDFIRVRTPLLTLHGHIHESPSLSGTWKHVFMQPGLATVSIQPGQDRHTVTIVEGHICGESDYFLRRQFLPNRRK